MDTVLRLKTLLICGYFLGGLTAAGVGQGIVFEPTKPDEEQRERVKERSAYMGASIGVAVPLGQFAERDYRNYFAGYANPGYTVKFIDAQYNFSKHVGMAVSWSRHQFGFAHDSVANLLRDNIFDADFQAQTTDPWILQAGLISGVLTVPSKVVDVDVKLGVGFLRALRPEVEVVGYDRQTGGLTYHWLQHEGAMFTALAGMGMHLRIHVLDGLDAMLSCDYQRAATTMNLTSTYGLSLTETEPLDQSFEILTLGLGMALTL